MPKRRIDIQRVPERSVKRYKPQKRVIADEAITAEQNDFHLKAGDLWVLAAERASQSKQKGKYLKHAADCYKKAEAARSINLSELVAKLKTVKRVFYKEYNEEFDDLRRTLAEFFYDIEDSHEAYFMSDSIILKTSTDARNIVVYLEDMNKNARGEVDLHKPHHAISLGRKCQGATLYVAETEQLLYWKKAFHYFNRACELDIDNNKNVIEALEKAINEFILSKPDNLLNSLEELLFKEYPIHRELLLKCILRHCKTAIHDYFLKKIEVMQADIQSEYSRAADLWNDLANNSEVSQQDRINYLREAIASINAGIESDPKDHTLLEQKANILEQFPSEIEFAVEQRELALCYFVLKYPLQAGPVMYLLAFQTKELKDYDLAIKYYKEIHPISSQAAIDIAVLSLHAAQHQENRAPNKYWDEAFSYLYKACGLNDDYFKDAIEVLEQAIVNYIETKPPQEKLDAFFNTYPALQYRKLLIKSLEDHKQYALAAKYCQRVAELASKHELATAFWKQAKENYQLAGMHDAVAKCFSQQVKRHIATRREFTKLMSHRYLSGPSRSPISAKPSVRNDGPSASHQNNPRAAK